MDSESLSQSKCSVKSASDWSTIRATLFQPSRAPWSPVARAQDGTRKEAVTHAVEQQQFIGREGIQRTAKPAARRTRVSRAPRASWTVAGNKTGVGTKGAGPDARGFA